MEPLNYLLWDTVIPKADSCKYLGINLRSDLCWTDQVNYIVKKGLDGIILQCTFLKKGNNNTESLNYTSLMHLILEYGAASWDPYREAQINALDQM
jgi:hypothetical protein